MKIAWKKDGNVYKDADPEKVAGELESLGLECKPENIVEFARDKNTELHKCFTWDDTIAAEKWRLHEARNILCHIVYIEDDNTSNKVPLRVFYKPDKTDHYEPTKMIIRDDDSYQKLLKTALRELKSFRRKYSMLKELTEINAMIDSLTD